MSMHTRVLAAILAALAIAVAGCGGNDDESGTSGASGTATKEASTPEADHGQEQGEEEEEAGAADKNCDEIGDLDGKAKRKLPKDVPLVAGARVYESQGP